ncbi:uncharacterized protein LTR77_010575 [Saxophila tyrrhenica]|uniref:NADP-dependent oxidoreductase domain-containing protein n=1 Tax=Saxophila tyrrhenica TaxID=1690608 RepID=A0AAV9NXP3_9PEZI|nr:hypothetical protein LTR77_010575 [Saxophila tyrrhenica]
MSLTVAGKTVGPIGFGMIGLNNPAKGITTEEAIPILKAALEAGSNFWNGGRIYGTEDYNSLHLLKAYFSKYPEDVEKVCVSIKACFSTATATAEARAEQVRENIEHCLAVADGKFRIDVFQAARLDPDVPVEETIGAIAEYVEAGKIGGVGITECSAASLKKAAAVTEIAAAELELSLFTTGILHNGLAEACREYSIPIIAYSPLSRGFLTGQIQRYEDMAENDMRRRMPRFFPENFDQNMKLVEEVEEVAKRKGCTAGQVAIAWVAKQSKSIGTPVMPIPGASAISRLNENLKIVELTDDELAEINTVLKKAEVKGDRYPAAFMKFLEV